MRLLFLVSDDCWSAHARVFLLAARGLGARGHDVMIACAEECPMQVHASEAEIALVKMAPGTSGAAATMQLRKALQQHEVDLVFVHSETELLMASSALRLGRRPGGVVRRIPPFVVAKAGRKGRFATRIAPTGLLFSTEQDRAAADAARQRFPAAVAPIGIDSTGHERVREIGKASLGAPADSRLIVCVHDGSDNHRVLTAMRSLSLLAPRHPELHLAIVGVGKLDELRMHGASLGVNAMITYLGVRDDELAIIRAADMGWIAGSDDAAAIAAMDFMAFGIPVLAERSPLTEHYVADGIAGVLLNGEDPTMTSAAVAAFLAKQEQIVQMGNAGRARLQRDFPYEAMIHGFEQAVGTALGRSAQPVA